MLLEIMRRISKLKYYRTPLLVIFSFLVGCMLTINLTPIDKTCRIENSDREYNIMRNSKLKNPELIILILSAPKNLDRRTTIRETWLKLADSYSDENTVRFKMKHYFVIGSLGLSADEILHLSTEQSIHSDILILPMYDSYSNITIKVSKSFEWLNEQYDYGLGFKYVLKCDDDSFVRVDKLAAELTIIELQYLKLGSNFKKDALSQYMSINAQVNSGITEVNWELYWGYFNGNARIKTSGKWKETDWIACDRYVTYALGGGYVLSRNLVSFIAKNAQDLRNFNSEDVSVGLWLAPVSNILRIHDVRFDTEWITRGCQNSHLITHSVSPEEMKTMYKNTWSTGNLCSSEIAKRNYYFYNWHLPPSQCCTPKLIN